MLLAFRFSLTKLAREIKERRTAHLLKKHLFATFQNTTSALPNLFRQLGKIVDHQPKSKTYYNNMYFVECSSN